MNPNPQNPFWTIRRVKSKWAQGLVDGGQKGGTDMFRRYPSEESALMRVCEDIQRIATQERIDPSDSMVAERKGSCVVVTVDPCGAVYVVRKVVRL